MPTINLSVPTKLTAPDPGWTIDTEVVVVGSGIAGLSTALRYVQRRPDGHVVLVTKDVISNGSTRWAQGGIAAALDPGDAPVAHMVDTVEAGAGMCDPLAVHVLATEGSAALRWLIELGTEFDRAPDGELALTREGGHRADRIAHAGGDATGAEIERALVAAVRAEPRIEVIEHALALDALTGERRTPIEWKGSPSYMIDTAVCGVTLHVMGEGQRDGVGAVRARAVVLATGGLGQTYAATTNPPVSTGDGLALAARADARLRDLEFVQFHPTVLWTGHEAHGQQPLVSEAVRGEGAFLVDTEGRRIMTGVHELGDLAPRDVVTRTIAQAMRDTGAPHVHLDGRHLGAATWEHRFPTILAECRAHGVDPVTDLIPVVPAAHYASGGVAVDIDGRTSVPGLYAVGEVARTGVHGANRLASNSLLEGVVFADRIAADLARTLPDPIEPETDPEDPASPGLVAPEAVPEVRSLMSRHAGVLRDLAGLRAARAELREVLTARTDAEPGVSAWEATNLATVAALVLAAASQRRESRGTHQRVDAPRQRPNSARRPIELTLGDDEIDVERLDWDCPLPSGLAAELDAIELPLFTGFREGARPELMYGAIAPRDHHVDTVLRALAEDLTGGAQRDVTTVATVPATQVSTADVVARADGVVAGLPIAELALWIVADGAVEIHRHVADGEEVKRGDVLMTVTARTRDLLTAERTLLNFLTHLSGIATATRAWVEAVAGTGARVRDTRKTGPGLRALEKYAVRRGGGVNHRFGLSDAALVKDNHVLAAGGVAQAVRAVREAFPDVPLEVEVDTLDQIEPALVAGAEELLLDNFTVPELAAAVRQVGGRARLEASGGLTLDTAVDVAATGVDYLAVGALTHSSPALDVALDLRPTGSSAQPPPHRDE